MNTYLIFLLLTITTFFTLINPLGSMPLFLSLTMSMTDSEKKKIAKKTVVVSFFILVMFALTGQMLFAFFNITVDSFKIVGGVIFFFMGFNMLNSSGEDSNDEANIENRDIAITPLAIPMIAGPGAITNAIILTEETSSVLSVGILIIGMGIVLFATYLIMVNSIGILKVIGKTGNMVMMKIMGLIVMVIAVEFFLAGIRPFIDSFL